MLPASLINEVQNLQLIYKVDLKSQNLKWTATAKIHSLQTNLN